MSSAINPKPLQIRIAQASDQLPVQRMLELYQYDLSNIWDQDLNAQGEYGYALDRYWNHPECTAFVALVNGHYVGFALVDQQVKVGSHGYWMDQFFILKKYRRIGLGKSLAIQVFNTLKGRWEVGQMPDNHKAQLFWRRLIAEFATGFDEHTLTGGKWEGIVQCFNSDTVLTRAR
ncbi:GNAT family N-acetyltransferase [Iodobacter arcticus]|uniref:GNAT family N-acetyltransferase n=1 Tax=Iodobacter arcticus TaxID=590593 RepID=A0ABW2QVQ0_9NEIS